MKLYYNSMQCSKIWEHYLIEIPDKISTTFRIYPCWNRLRRNNKKHSNFHQWFKNVQIEKNKILPRLTFFYSLSTRIPSYERKERKEGSKILEGMDEEIIASWGHRSIEADNFVAGNSNWRDPMRATFIKLVRPTFLSFFLSPRTGGRYVSEKQKLQQTRALFSSVPTDEKRVNDSRTRWYHKLDGPYGRCVRQLSETMIIGETCSSIFDEKGCMHTPVEKVSRYLYFVYIYVWEFYRVWKGTSAIWRWRGFDGEILKLILRFYVRLSFIYKPCQRGKFVFTFVVVERGFLFFYECRKMLDVWFKGYDWWKWFRELVINYKSKKLIKRTKSVWVKR